MQKDLTVQVLEMGKRIKSRIKNEEDVKTFFQLINFLLFSFIPKIRQKEQKKLQDCNLEKKNALLNNKNSHNSQYKLSSTHRVLFFGEGKKFDVIIHLHIFPYFFILN